MSRGDRFSHRARTSALGKAIESVMEDNRDLLNAIDFIESPQGLGVHLYPVQRVIVKAIFGVSMDYKEGEVPVHDPFGEKLLYTFTDREYLEYVYNEGRCNVKNWQDLPLDGFHEAVIFAGRRGGKALDVDEVVPTPGGFVRNGDLKAGDMVFSPSGNPTRVRLAHEPFLSKIYRVTFDDGTSTLAHPGHLWHTWTHLERRNLRSPLTKAKSGEGSGSGGQNVIKRPILGGVRTTEDIKASLLHGKERNHAIKISASIELPEQELLVDPYCLGVWLGDGAKDHPYITAKDDDGWEIMSHFTTAGIQWKKDPKASYNWCTYGLATKLRKLNLLMNKHVPEQYLWASAAQRLALLQGLMDTDGYCAIDGQCEFANTNRSLSEGVYHLAASLGLKPFWKEGRATLYGKDCGPYYSVFWTGTLPVFRLQRKLDRLPTKVRPLQEYRTIVSIEDAGERLVRCITVEDPDGLFLFGKNFNVTHNSQVVSAIGGYSLYKLLNVKSPQEYFSLVPGSPIDFTFLAQDDEGSNRLYDKLREDINRGPFFGPFMRSPGGASALSFVTEADREKRDATPTIHVASYPCTTNAVRGPSSIFLALDEFAHFRSAKGSSSDEVYDAATPATMQFVNPDKEREALILSISSPLKKVGKMYDLHRLAMEHGVESGIFTLRTSTAEMNPRSDSQFLRREFEKSPMTWKAEYGGNFLESSETYVTEAQIMACVDQERENSIGFNVKNIGREYFWAIDLGMIHDATALGIGHLEYVGPKRGVELVFDYLDRMMVGEKFTGPGVQNGLGEEKYLRHTVLILDDILSWLEYMNNILPCFKGATDQHGGQQLVQLLELKRIYNVELVNLTPAINSQMYFALKGFIENVRCRLPNVPKFITELKNVEAEFTNKYQIRVEAPAEKGSHDDMADVAALVALQAAEWLNNEKHLLLDPSGSSLMANERLGQPAAVMPNMDALSMSDIKTMTRQQKLLKNMGIPGFVSVKNPFHKRGRR